MRLSRAWIVWIALVAAMPGVAADALEARLVTREDRAAIEQLVTGDYPRTLDQRRLPHHGSFGRPLRGRSAQGGGAVEVRETRDCQRSCSAGAGRSEPVKLRLPKPLLASPVGKAGLE